MKTKGWFPRYLTAPIQFLWWEADEMIPFLALAIIGLFGNQLILGLGAGIAFFRVLVHAKNKLSEGFLVHFVYALGIKEIKGYPTYLADKFKE